MAETFKYKLSPRPPKMPLNRLNRQDVTEPATGFVKGREASELEEIWAGAEDRAGRDYIFKYIIETAFQIPGQLNEIDFVDTTEIWTPIEIDGEFAHKSAEQKESDSVRDAIINDVISNWGWNPIIRIPGYTIETPDEADAVLREIFYG